MVKRNEVLIALRLEILPPATLVDIANAILSEIKELHENHNDNPTVISAREVHKTILKYLDETYGDEWLDNVQS